MPLGFLPLASGPSGASAAPTPTIVTVGGVTVPVLGLSATASFGTATAIVGMTIAVQGIEAATTLGQIGVLTPSVTTVYPLGVEAVGQIGEAPVASSIEVVLEGLEAVGVQSPIDYIAVGTAILSSVAGTGQIGTVTANTPERWIEIEPVSVPGWSNVPII